MNDIFRLKPLTNLRITLKRFIYFLDMDKQVMKKIKIVILRKRIGTENKSNKSETFCKILPIRESPNF